jgi:hypothetical protein
MRWKRKTQRPAGYKNKEILGNFDDFLLHSTETVKRKYTFKSGEDIEKLHVICFLNSHGLGYVGFVLRQLGGCFPLRNKELKKISFTFYYEKTFGRGGWSDTKRFVC